jgi:MFS family permease
MRCVNLFLVPPENPNQLMKISISDANYKWYILSLGIITNILVTALPWIALPMLFPEISRNLNLDLVQIGMIWGMTSLPGIFVSLFVGILIDRFGTAKVLAVTCLLTGIACGLRGLAGGYTSLLIFNMVFGLVISPLSFVTHNAAGQWFSGKQLGMANGILAMGMGVGCILGSMITATVLSPWLGGWQTVMLAYSIVPVLMALVWLQTKNRVPPQTDHAGPTETISFQKSIAHVIRLKPVWILGIAYACIIAYRTGISGYLPTYLEGIGWSTVNTAGVVSALSAASVLGVVPVSFLSDRIGLRKAVIIPVLLLIFVNVGLLGVIQSGAIWLIVILIGIFQEGVTALLLTLTMETKGVGVVYAGTALGLVATFAKVGGLLGPPLGNSLATVTPGYGFFFWAGAVVLAIICFLFVKETGWRKNS